MGYKIYLFVCQRNGRLWLFLRLSFLSYQLYDSKYVFLKIILNVLFFFITYPPTCPLDCSVRTYHFIIITNANWLAPMPSSLHHKLLENLMILRSRLFRAIWTFFKTPPSVLFFFNQWCIIFKLVPISKIHNLLYW